MWIGSHVSIAKGFCAAVEASVAMGANTFQFFTRNPRGGNAKALDLEDIAKGRAIMLEKAFGPPVAHAPYTYNLCSARPEVVVFTMAHLEEDFSRLQAMGVDRVVLHPGTHGGQGTETGIRMISENLNQLLPLAEAAGVRILRGRNGRRRRARWAPSSKNWRQSSRAAVSILRWGFASTVVT